MKQIDLYNRLLARCNSNLTLLDDKPEETFASTLRAMWFAASEQPRSAGNADQGELPELDLDQVDALHAYVGRRLNGEPLAHITGRQLFMGIEFLVTPEALVPRKETEILGNAAIRYLHDIAQIRESLTVIDVCTGSGNLAISYAILEPGVKVYAADLGEGAVALARRNVKYHDIGLRVDIRQGDLLSPFNSQAFHGKVDLLSCNPPYISSAKVDTMNAEISSHEPRLAFDGGPFGIKILLRLIKEAPLYLRAGGYLMFEVGLGQGSGMIQILNKDNNFDEIRPVLDDSGGIRAIAARRFVPD